MTFRLLKSLAVAASMALSLTATVATATDFPTRDITITVSYAAGGSTDLAARLVARRMEKELGVPVVVANRTGAQGTVGQNYVRLAKPDGYNIAIVTSSSTSMSPYLVNNIYKPSDFDYLGGLGVTRFGLAVRAESPYQTIKEFVEAAKLQPQFFGTSSGVTNLGFTDLARKTGAKFEAVNYKSGPEIVNAIIGGQVAALMQTPGEIMPHVQSGRMRLLASVSPTRWPAAPNVPTLRDAGYDVAVESWLGFAVPKGLPEDVLAKLQAALRKVATEPGVSGELDTMGMDASFITGAQFAAKMQSTFVEVEPIMKALAGK